MFALLGTTYGGNGATTFMLPNLQGRVAVGPGQRPGGSNYVLGQIAGAESVTLNQSTLGVHSHAMNASSTVATLTTPVGNSLATLPTGRGGVGGKLYSAGPTNTTLAPAVVQPAGGNQPHENRQPYLALRYIIALQGVFPSRP